VEGSGLCSLKQRIREKRDVVYIADAIFRIILDGILLEMILKEDIYEEWSFSLKILMSARYTHNYEQAA
jgi:hypothetical protein